MTSLTCNPRPWPASPSSSIFIGTNHPTTPRQLTLANSQTQQPSPSVALLHASPSHGSPPSCVSFSGTLSRYLSIFMNLYERMCCVMCMCVFVCTCVCVRVCTCANVYVCVQMYISVHTCVSTCIVCVLILPSLFVYTYVNPPICLSLHVAMCVLQLYNPIRICVRSRPDT